MGQISLEQFSDCREVMDLALERPGLQVHFDSTGEAISFRTRCNKYRRMVLESLREAHKDIPGFRPESSYDGLLIRLLDERGLSARSGLVVEFLHRKAPGRIYDPASGEWINLNLPRGDEPEVTGLGPLGLNITDPENDQ